MGKAVMIRTLVVHLLACLIIVVVLVSCGGSTPKNSGDTTKKGTIHISVDESFKPVIDSQIQVFESQNPEAHIIVHYKPEAECLRDLNNDSFRMVIVTRGLSRDEQDILRDTLKFNAIFGPIAYDAIAIIVNNKVKDTLMTMEDIRSLVKGTSGFPYKVLMDGRSATSTVRFVNDSLLRGQELAKTVMGAKNSQGVIDYIAKNTDAVGFVGVSWIGNPEDTTQLSFLEKVKIVKIECRGCTGTFVAPVPYNIATSRYPMVRPLYYILKENYNGLGSGFVNFLIY
ncbi:MAG TPA: substrate-binding domain-containing protein, partial [Flavitalea sp.]|nr:substrate-binding domain-containing protein [Flavitalea sp.]